jgi:CheY-like chemotaxis protein
MATILVVDDEPAVLALSSRVLRMASHSVVEAAGGEQAWGYFQEQPHTTDLLLTDVIMPGVTGPELARRVRELRPDLPVLYMTAYSPADLLARGLEVGEANVVRKPFDHERLLSSVDEALAGRRDAASSPSAVIARMPGLGPEVQEVPRTAVLGLRRRLAGLRAVVAEVDRELRYVWIDNPHPDFDPIAVVGRRDDELLPAAEAEEIISLKLEVFESGEPRSRVLGFNRSDGRVYYSMHAYPLREPHGALEAVLTVGMPRGPASSQP